MTSEGARKAWKTRKRNERAQMYSERARKAWRTIRARERESCTPAKVECERETPKYTPMAIRRTENMIRLEERHRTLGELLLIAKANKNYHDLGEAVTEYMQRELCRVTEELENIN